MKTMLADSGTEESMTFGRTITFELPPFGISPNTRMIFAHPRFDTARQGLVETIVHGNGFGVVTGEVGTGKTTLLHSVIADLPDYFDTAMVMNTCLKPDELLFAIGEDLGLKNLTPDMTRRQILNAINAKVLSNIACGRRTAIVIDEAQHLSDETLETVRMISNLQTQTERPVGIILFGQPPLREMLKRPELSPFVSRIGAHYRMDALSLAETTEYIRHRIVSSRPSRMVTFSEGAVKLLHRCSSGLPRRINIVAGKALCDALAAGRNVVEEADVRRVSKTVVMAIDPKARERNLVTAASWLLLFSLIAFGGREYYFAQAKDPAMDAKIVPVPVQAIATPAVAATIEPNAAAEPVEAPLFPRPLSVGARGEDVLRLQQLLGQLGYFRVTPTGKFGHATRNAVRRYQSANAIGEDGVVGPLTIEALEAETDRI